MSPSEIWTEQCEAARGIAEDFGTEKALGYLVGEKLLTFLQVAESNADFRNEIAPFVAEIKEIFEPWQLAEYLNTPRRLGPVGHTLSDEEYEVFREADGTNEPAVVGEMLTAFEWAKELLLEKGISA